MSVFDPREPDARPGASEGRGTKRLSRRTGRIAVVTVGAIAIIAILLGTGWVLGGGGDRGSSDGATSRTEKAPDAAGTSAGTGGTAGSVDGKSVCGLPGYEASGTLTTAPEAEWTIVGTMAAPDSPTSGPGIISDDGLRSCYAHTVEGAVLMTANMWAMGSDPDLTTLFTEQMTAPGAGRDLMLTQTTKRSDSGLRGQIVGFTVMTYSDTDATVDTAFQLSDGRLISFPFALKWVEGDWKAVVADDGTPSFRPVELRSLGGYVVWGGLS